MNTEIKRRKKYFFLVQHREQQKEFAGMCRTLFFISPDTFYKTVPVTLTVASKMCCCAVETAIISCPTLHACTKSCYSAMKILVNCKKVTYKYCQIIVSVTCTIYISFILRYSLEFVFLREYDTTTKTVIPNFI